MRSGSQHVTSGRQYAINAQFPARDGTIADRARGCARREAKMQNEYGLIRGPGGVAARSAGRLAGLRRASRLVRSYSTPDSSGGSSIRHRRGRGRRPTGRANPQPNWRGLWRKRVHFHSHGSSPDIRRPDSHTLDADPLALATLGHIMSASVRLRLLPPAAHRRLATLIKVALQSLELVPVGVGRRVGRERQLRAHQLLHALLVRRVERLELFALAPRVGCELAQVLRRRVGATV